MQELEDRWILPLRGARVTGVSFDGDFLLTLDPPTDIQVSLNAELSVGAPTMPGAAPVRLADASDADIAGLTGATVLSAVAFKDGSLRLVFDSRHHITLDSDDPGARARVRRPGEFDLSADGTVTQLRPAG